MAADEDEWVEIKRFGDPIGADMICDFLREHDVRVQLRGNTQATRMTWSQTSDNIRIVVLREDLEKAHEALAAMNQGEARGHPFRDLSAPKDDDEAEEKFVKPRSVIAAAFLAFILPIGAGHFYARHGAAGTILLAGIAGALLASFFGAHYEVTARAWGILVLADAVGAVLAVRRFNARRPMSEGSQRQWAAVAVLVAFALAWATAG
ncbi:MAG: DUF2007 domain-containing protein [Labilithrix sp.]|nr:DUF2007 domain-containing protein [Labilithrix sp.]